MKELWIKDNGLVKKSVEMRKTILLSFLFQKQ